MDLFMSVPNLFGEIWVWFALAAALGYAGVGFIDEYLLSENEDEESDNVGTLVLVSGFFGVVIAVVAFAYSAIVEEGSSLMIEPELKWKAMAAGALEVVWLIPYLYAVNRSGVMNVAPIFQAIPIFALLIGGVFFGEIPTTFHVIGSFAIVLGSFILNSGALMEGVDGGWLSKMFCLGLFVSFAFLGPMFYILYSVLNTAASIGVIGLVFLLIFVAFVKAKVFRVDIKTIALMFFACVVIAVVYFLFKGTVLEGNFIAATFWSGIGMAAFTLFVAVGRPVYRKQFIRFLKRGSWRALSVQTFNEGLNTFSVLASHMANVKAPSVMLASTFNCFHPIFTLMIGGVVAIFGSEKHRNHLKGSFIKMVIAISMIAIGTVVVSL